MATTATYRSINMTATMLGIDRRLCILILLLSFLVFRHATFLSALMSFALLWSGAYWVTKHDVQLVVITPKALTQRRMYDPAKFNMTATWWGVDRRLLIVILLVCLLVFYQVTFLASLLVGGLLWPLAYWVTIRERRMYDPAK